MNTSLVLDTPRTQSWRTTLPALVLWLALIGALFYDTFAAMVGIWSRSETFAHAFAVPPLVLWMVWRRRAVLAPMAPVVWPIALVPFGLAALGWLAGRLVAANAVMQLSATAMLVLAVPALAGWQVTRVILFPLVYLFFAVPIGEFMIPPLMQWTADFTVWALRLSGIPVYREGLQFVIPSGNWSVVEACSGVRYLMASFMVGTLFGYLNYQSWQRRWIFAGVSLLVPIVANWLRAYGIVMLGHLSGNQLAVGADHLIYGWVFFGIVITLLFMIGARWAESPLSLPMPVAAMQVSIAPKWRAGLLGVFLSAAMLAGLPLSTLLWLHSRESRLEPQLVLPAVDPRWRQQVEVPPSWVPAFVAPSARARGRYVDANGRAVDLHILYYRNQGGDRKLISSINAVVKSNDPVWGEVSVSTISAPDGLSAVRESVLHGRDVLGVSEGSRLRVWQIYRADGVWTTSDTHATLLTAAQRLKLKGDDGAVVFMSAAESTAGGAASVLGQFLQHNRSHVEKLLEQVQSGR